MRSYGRRRRDEVDEWCRDWARERRVALGIMPGTKIEPRERVGKLRCTLAEVRDEGAAGHSSKGVHCDLNGKPVQHWPEVYRGFTLFVHLALAKMPGAQRMVIHLHYVWRELPSFVKAHEAGVGLSEFYSTLNAAKESLRRTVIGER